MKPAVIAIVKGGLGNQFFIYAAARALALRTNRSLFLDRSRGYTKETYGRSYRLDRFPIRAETMPEAWRVAPTLKHAKHRFVRAISRFIPQSFRGYHAERKQLDATQLTQLKPRRLRVMLNGYWQSGSFFEDHAATIRTELQLPVPTDDLNLRLGREYATESSVFLHVRRVRYRQLLEAGYYQKAIDEACEQAGATRFLIFGDDPQWALDNLQFHGRPAEVISHNSDDEIADLWLMSRCRHAIAANSSFSWWAAWLGGESTPERRVWFPSETGLQLQAAAGWSIISATVHGP